MGGVGVRQGMWTPAVEKEECELAALSREGDADMGRESPLHVVQKQAGNSLEDSQVKVAVPYDRVWSLPEPFPFCSV